MIRLVSNTRNFFLNSLHRSYKMKVEKGDPDGVLYEMQQIINDHHIKHDRKWLFDHPRQWEIERPGRYDELYRRERVRKADREFIAFFCKYVMTKKKVAIPKN